MPDTANFHLARLCNLPHMPSKLISLRKYMCCRAMAYFYIAGLRHHNIF